MPEISEVRLTAQFVTQANKNRIIQDVSYLKTNKLKLVEEIDVVGKKISAISRGKELKLFFDNKPVVISLGMKIGRAHVRTPVTEKSRMPSSA